MYLFSKETLAFYPVEHIDAYQAAGTLPGDVIEVDDSIRDTFNFTPLAGKKLGTDRKGNPVWVDRTQQELAEGAALQKQWLLNQASEFINNRQWPGKAALSRLTSDDVKQYGEWLDYLDALEAVDTSGAADIVWPAKPD